MSGIAGFCSFTTDYKKEPEKWLHILEAMNASQKHRGKDGERLCLNQNCGLGYIFMLPQKDALNKTTPECNQHFATKYAGSSKCGIIYDGEIYNMPELIAGLRGEGAWVENFSDAEVILAGYIRHGISYMKQLNGVFSIALWDERYEKLLLFRDRAGVKPLFYTLYNHNLIFASEIKGLFAYPGIKPLVDKEGLCEVLGLGPAKTYGKGVFKDIFEVVQGCYLEFSKEGMQEYAYWKLESRPHEDSYEKTVEKTEYLVTDAIKRQMFLDESVCSLLSGGVDSSFVTAVASKELKKQGKVLDTFSFDFKDNHVNFKSSTFQPTEDREWVDKMKEFAGTNHHYLECNNDDLIYYLFKAVNARDLPCMGDIESSILYFCKEVSKYSKAALTGECADEIFGGYPWFRKQECLDAKIFPWSMDFTPRKILLKDEVLAELPIEEYAKAAYEKTISETPVLLGETGEAKRRREIAYLNLKWFMQTLLDRMERASTQAGLTARVPFADYRIIEYLWNVPWDMKYHEGIVKGLLRAAGKTHLPMEVLYRKKSPYPKTYDPTYEQILKDQIMEVANDNNAPINQLIDKKKLEEFIRTPSDYGKPFYGQLMAGPQQLAFFLQINYWLEHYKISLV